MKRGLKKNVGKVLRKTIQRGGENKTENKCMGETLRKEGLDRLREKKEPEKKRKTDNKERRNRFREWVIWEWKKRKQRTKRKEVDKWSFGRRESFWDLKWVVQGKGREKITGKREGFQLVLWPRERDNLPIFKEWKMYSQVWLLYLLHSFLYTNSIDYGLLSTWELFSFISCSWNFIWELIWTYSTLTLRMVRWFACSCGHALFWDICLLSLLSTRSLCGFTETLHF